MKHAEPRQLERVRLYHQVRTAHLERAAQLPPATIVYGDTRYDFDDSLSAGLDLVHAKGVKAAWFMFRRRIAVLEVNEPLFIHAARSTALALLGLQLRQLVGGGRTQVVSYAIENLDPRDLPRPGSAKHRLARRLDLALAGLIWRRLDKIVYGTDAAQQLYAAAYGSKGAPESTVIPALPTPLRRADSPAKQTNQVLFLGALSDRKGLRPLLGRLDVRPRRGAGRSADRDRQGPAAGAGRAARGRGRQHRAADRPAPRPDQTDQLDASQVLVLASQPQPAWREQVGLPIVEALAYGCTVVTTDQTGLAEWLAEHGHQVISTADSVPDLAGAVAAALHTPVPIDQVLASLPARDARLAADDWLFAGVGNRG